MNNLSPALANEPFDPATRAGRRLRVLMVAVRYYPFMGGVETHIFEVAPRLVQNNIEVTVITHDPDGKLPAEETVRGVRIIRVRGWPAQRDFCISPELTRRIRQGEWDVVHCQGYHTLFIPQALLAARQAKIPYLLSFHSGGHSSKLRNSLRGIQRQVLRPLLAEAERLVAVSRFEAAFFQQKLRLPADKFVVVPNGASLPEIDRAGLPATGPEKLILSVGRLERYKGHHRVIEALPEVLKACPQARLRIAGSGPYEKELRRVARTLGVESRVEIGAIPPQDRRGMARLLSQAALVTLFSEYEAHPIAVMEALAMGRPVLAAATSGLQELAERNLVRSLPLESTPQTIARGILEQLAGPLVPASVELPTWEECASDLHTLYCTVSR